MAVGIGNLKLQAVRKTLFQTHLQPVIIRKKIGAKRVNSRINIWIRTPRGSGNSRICRWYSLISIEQAKEIRAVRTYVRNFQNCIGRELVLESHEPLLHERRLDMGID